MKRNLKLILKYVIILIIAIMVVTWFLNIEFGNNRNIYQAIAIFCSLVVNTVRIVLKDFVKKNEKSAKIDKILFSIMMVFLMIAMILLLIPKFVGDLLTNI